MPDLNFKKWGKEFDHILIHRTNAVMLFPGDADKRNQYLATRALPHLISGRFFSQIPGPEATFEEQREDVGHRVHLHLILESGGFNSVIDSPTKNEIKNQIKKGMVAGAILLLVHGIEQWKPGKGSLSKAYFLLGKLLGKGARTSGFPGEARTIQKYFNEMVNVAHLWCASLFDYYLGEEMKFSEFKKFLALSESIRKKSEGFYPHPKSPSPILDNNHTWKVPKKISLPKIKFPIDHLTDEENKILKSYRAPTRPSR